MKKQPKTTVNFPVYALDIETFRRLCEGLPNRSRNLFLKAVLRQAASMTTEKKIQMIAAEQMAALQGQTS